MILSFLMDGTDSIAIVGMDAFELDADADVKDEHVASRIAEVNSLRDNCFFLPSAFQKQTFLFVNISLLSEDEFELLWDTLDELSPEYVESIKASPLLKLKAEKL